MGSPAALAKGAQTHGSVERSKSFSGSGVPGGVTPNPGMLWVPPPHCTRKGKGHFLLPAARPVLQGHVPLETSPSDSITVVVAAGRMLLLCPPTPFPVLQRIPSCPHSHVPRLCLSAPPQAPAQLPWEPPGQELGLAQGNPGWYQAGNQLRSPAPAWAPVAGVGMLLSLVSVNGICLLQQWTFTSRSWALGLAFCPVLFSPFS